MTRWLCAQAGDFSVGDLWPFCHPAAMISWFRFGAMLLAALAGMATSFGALSPAPPLVDVFINGQDGYPAFRIPSLIVTKRGLLLAFAEGRASLRDHAENDIVLKRSTDEGKTWGPLQLVHEDGANSLGNPTGVIVGEAGRVLLMYQRYAAGFDEHRAEPGLDGPRICRTFTQHSDDDGTTWSKPVEVTAQVKRPVEVTSTATGPGIGIQLARGKHAGRILMPFNQGPYGKWKVYAAFSDDGGQSWRYGETAPEGSAGFANEVQFVELSDGSLMLNARNQGGGEKRRKISISRDGGETWSTTRHDATLIEPVCQATILRHPGSADRAKDVFLFCNPATQIGRTNGTVRLSRDEGKTWPVSRVLYPGGFAYSCLGSLPDGSVGCLFERDGTKRISFARFTIGWVEGKE
jgi:sialidase-1